MMSQCEKVSVGGTSIGRREGGGSPFPAPSLSILLSIPYTMSGRAYCADLTFPTTGLIMVARLFFPEASMVRWDGIVRQFDSL